MIGINKRFYDYLYNELGAYYQIAPSAVEDNLNNNTEENLKYLGTYFPRSFTEAYYIYKDLFENKEILERYKKKRIIRILDIGSGIGGSLFGLIQVIMEKFEGKKVEIVSIEGNRNAVNLQVKILKNLSNLINGSNKIIGRAYIHTVLDKNDLSVQLNYLKLQNSIDIMQSFKVVNEFYRKDYEKNKGMYVELLRLGDNMLKNSGILCIADVTNKINNGEFASIIFTEEIRKFMCTEKSNLEYILPKCCAVNYKKCSKENICFSKRTFKVHFKNFVNESKINYKVFIKPHLGIKVKRDIINNTYKKCYEKNCYCINSCNKSNCTKILEYPYLLEGVK